MRLKIIAIIRNELSNSNKFLLIYLENLIAFCQTNNQYKKLINVAKITGPLAADNIKKVIEIKNKRYDTDFCLNNSNRLQKIVTTLNPKYIPVPKY